MSNLPSFLTGISPREEGIVDMHGNLISADDRNKIITQISDLPINPYLEDIAYSIMTNAITIIEAKTGSGKTTQVGKIAPFINLGKRGLNHVNMTQPRVLAASSNAKRISEELLSQINNPAYTIGHRVGYKTGVSENSSSDTKLLLTTDGLEVMRQLVSGLVPDILIIDEVHNYTIHTEILLSKVKEYMLETKRDVKVVIMSATLDKKLILDFYKDVSKNIPYFEIPGRVHKINDHIEKSDKLVESAINIYNKGTSCLVFVEGKKAIYDTISKIERVLEKSDLDSLIKGFQESVDDKIITLLEVNLKTFLISNTKYGDKSNIFSELLDLRGLEKHISFILSEFEKKYNDNLYKIDKEKIYNELYRLLSSFSFEQRVNDNEVLSVSERKEFLKSFQEIDDFYNILFNIINNIVYKLDYIDEVVEDFNRNVKNDIIGEINILRLHLDKVFSDSSYIDKKDLFLSSFDRIINFSSIYGLIFNLTSFFYSFDKYGKNIDSLNDILNQIERRFDLENIKLSLYNLVNGLRYTIKSNEISQNEFDILISNLSSIKEIDTNFSIDFGIKLQELSSNFLSLGKDYFEILNNINSEISNIKNILGEFFSPKEIDDIVNYTFEDFFFLINNFGTNSRRVNEFFDNTFFSYDYFLTKLSNKINSILRIKAEKDFRKRNKNLYSSIYKDIRVSISSVYRDCKKGNNKEITGKEYGTLKIDSINLIIRNCIEEYDDINLIIENILIKIGELKIHGDFYIKLKSSLLEYFKSDYFEDLVSIAKNKINNFESNLNLISKKNFDKKDIINKISNSNNLNNILNQYEDLKDIFFSYSSSLEEVRNLFNNYQEEKNNYLYKVYELLDKLFESYNDINLLKELKSYFNFSDLITYEDYKSSISKIFLSLSEKNILRLNFSNLNLSLNESIELSIGKVKSSFKIVDKDDKNEQIKSIENLIINLKSVFEKFFSKTNLYLDFLDLFHNTIDFIDKSKENIVGNVFPLHSDLPPKEQNIIFGGSNKIIVSTNIAEMSLTIPNIGGVVDSGKEKIVFLNENGVEELSTIDISKAQSNQRRGRTGRMGPGEYIWANESNIDNLRDFPETEIEIGSLDRHYLICLSSGTKFEEMDFLHKPKDYSLIIAKRKLKLLGAIDKNGNITELGEFIIMLPVESHIGRIIYEGIKRKCIGGLINICSILSSKDFIESKNKKWKKIDFEGKDYRKQSDLFLLDKIFTLITSYKITEFEYIQLAKLGIKRSQLDSFMTLEDNDKMLFEMVDLDLIGIKEKYVYEIIDSKIQITKSLKQLGVKLYSSKIPSKRDILLSIITGFPDNVFKYSKKDNFFYNLVKGRFERSSVSSISEEGSKFFIGLPFIIDDGKNKKGYLSRISLVEESDIKEALAKNIKLDNSRLQLGTKKISVPGKGGKKIKRQVVSLMQTNSLDLVGLNLSDISYELGHDSFEDMFKTIYLPDLLILENKYFISLVNKLKEDTPEGYELDISRLRSIIGNFTGDLYDHFTNSKKSLRKLEAFFRDDKSVYDKVVISDLSENKDFFLDPYLKKS